MRCSSARSAPRRTSSSHHEATGEGQQRGEQRDPERARRDGQGQERRPRRVAATTSGRSVRKAKPAAAAHSPSAAATWGVTSGSRAERCSTATPAPDDAGDDPGQRHEPGGRQGAEPARVVGTDHVEHEEAEADDGQGLPGEPQVAPAQPDAEPAAGGGEEQQHHGPAAHAEPGPGDREEGDGGDQQAEHAEAEQDAGHRRGAEAGPGRGGDRGGVVRRDRARHRGRPQPGQQPRRRPAGSRTARGPRRR